MNMAEAEKEHRQRRTLLRLLFLVAMALAVSEILSHALGPRTRLPGNLVRPSAARVNRSDPGSVKNSMTTIAGRESLVYLEDKQKNSTELPLCEVPSNLGPIKLNVTAVLKDFPAVHWGGQYAPPDCTARDAVAIIIPYRDRLENLKKNLNHMHPFLMKQRIDYGIYVVEQQYYPLHTSDPPEKIPFMHKIINYIRGLKPCENFNRGKLMNVGFVESQRLRAGGWGCCVFHDVDLLPLDLRNLYSCPRQPRQMVILVGEAVNRYYGGVTAMTVEQFRKVNGFANRFWGWAGEDEDLHNRLEHMNYHKAHYKLPLTRYFSLNHEKRVPSPLRHDRLTQTKRTMSKDGLSSLKYKLIDVVRRRLFTHIIVDICETH